MLVLIGVDGIIDGMRADELACFASILAASELWGDARGHGREWIKTTDVRYCTHLPKAIDNPRL